MRTHVFLFFTITLFLGCVSSKTAPIDNRQFLAIESVEQIRGTFRNEGDPPKYNLSKILWGNGYVHHEKTGRPISHSEIEVIEVRTYNQDVIVSALGSGCVLFQMKYVADRDFAITDGTIKLKTDINVLTRGPGDLLVGPSIQSLTLGLDDQGDAKYRDESYFGGLVLLMFPMAGSEVNDVKFKKMAAYQKHKGCVGE